MTQYTIDYHEEDGQWWADSPDVPGYSAWGGSLEEVRALVREGLAFATDNHLAEPHERLTAARVPATSRDEFGAVRNLWTVISGVASDAAATFAPRAGAPAARSTLVMSK